MVHVPRPLARFGPAHDERVERACGSHRLRHVRSAVRRRGDHPREHRNGRQRQGRGLQGLQGHRSALGSRLRHHHRRRDRRGALAHLEAHRGQSRHRGHADLLGGDRVGQHALAGRLDRRYARQRLLLALHHRLGDTDQAPHESRFHRQQDRWCDGAARYGHAHDQRDDHRRRSHRLREFHVSVGRRGSDPRERRDGRQRQGRALQVRQRRRPTLDSGQRHDHR